MADYGTLAQQQVQKNFPKFGNIRKLCTYKHASNSTYNATTGAVTEVLSAGVSLYVIFDTFSFTSKMAPERHDDDTAVLSIDKKVMFPTLDLSGAAPSYGDVLIDPDGIIWKVIGKSTDPASALQELHIRPYDK